MPWGSEGALPRTRIIPVLKHPPSTRAHLQHLQLQRMGGRVLSLVMLRWVGVWSIVFGMKDLLESRVKPPSECISTVLTDLRE